MANKKKQKKAKSSSPSSPFPNWSWFERYTHWFIILLTLIAFGLRIYRVDYLSFWFDEYSHVLPIRDFIKYGEALIGDDMNGILLTFFITPLFQLFSMNEFWARLPSAVLGACTIPLTYQLGKKLFNNWIGFFAALLITFSFYHTFWSRIARMYACFTFFFTLLLLIFYYTYEKLPQAKKHLNFYKKFGLNRNYLIALPFVFIFALLSHQLTYFFIFGLGAYASTIAVYKIVKGHPNRFLNKYAVLLYPTFLGVLLLMPFSENLIRYILELFLRERMVNVVIPDWDYIFNTLGSAKRFKAINNYFGIVSTDYTYLCFLAPVGLIASFFYKKRSGVFLFSFYVFSIFLMTFIFSKRPLPRYFLYTHPLFVISIAIAIYTILKYLIPLILPKNIAGNKFVKALLLIGLIRLIFFDVPVTNIKKVLTTKEHGRVVPKKIATWYFTNWRYPSQYVYSRMKQNDVIISTVPKATDFYLDINSTIWFRQRTYDTKKEKYVFKEAPEDMQYHATTYQGFANTVKSHQRGWLLADYYFYNAMTDPRARNFAIRNLRYHYYANTDGSVKVFSWDHSTPQPAPKQFVIELGKNGKAAASKVLNIKIPNYNQANRFRFIIDGQNIDANEAVIVLNKKNGKYLPKNKNPRKRGKISVSIPKKWLKKKDNKLQFQFKKGEVNNPRFYEPGFAIYNVQVQPM